MNDSISRDATDCALVGSSPTTNLIDPKETNQEASSKGNDTS